MTMTYRQPDIDRGIVMTQADLRGFYHPLGVRIKPTVPKFVFYATVNLPAFMAGVSNDDYEVDPTFVSADSDATYEQHVTMVKTMAEACDASQTEAIELILRSITRKMSTYRKQRDTGEYDGPDRYVHELTKDNIWGITVLAMREGFADKFKQLRKNDARNRKAA